MSLEAAQQGAGLGGSGSLPWVFSCRPRAIAPA